MDRNVGVHLLSRHELELVDDLLLMGISHRKKNAVPAHEDRQDAIRLGQLPGHHVEVLEHERDLRQIDSGDAILL